MQLKQFIKKKAFEIGMVIFICAIIIAAWPLFVFLREKQPEADKIGNWRLASYTNPTLWVIEIDDVTDISTAARSLEKAKKQWEVSYPHLRIKQVRIEMTVIHEKKE